MVPFEHENGKGPQAAWPGTSTGPGAHIYNGLFGPDAQSRGGRGYSECWRLLAPRRRCGR
jgi:hypothetical protein